MIHSSYYNSRTGSSATFDVRASVEQREITVEVRVYNAQKHSAEKFTFLPKHYGKAIDFYNETVKKFEEE